jgi:TolB protein
MTKFMKKGKFLKIQVLIIIVMVLCSCKEESYPIAYSSSETGDREIYLTDAEGKTKIKITNNPGADGYPDWSPDGKHIVFYAKYDFGKTWSMHTMNRDGTNRKRLTHEKNKWDSSPTWSPDGKKIAFAREYSDSEGNWQEEVWIMNADGSEQTQLKTISGRAPCFMKDGRILFHSKPKSSQICIANSDGSNIVTLTNTTAEDRSPEISPDGKHIAFISDRDGNKEVYIMDIDGTNQKRLTHNTVPDWDICWSPDSSKIIFSSDTGEHLDLYMINKDGSRLKKFITNGSQPSWLN